MIRPRCGAKVTRSESKKPSIQIVAHRLVLGPPDVRWWCDVAHTHLTKQEAIECNRRTVLINRLHQGHGHA